MSDLLSLTSKFSAAASRIRRTNGEIALSTYQLSSGKRIQYAGQDVASVSVIAKLQSGIAALKTASNNLAQATSLLQVADGGLAQIGAMLERAYALALRGANTSLGDNDRAYIDIELAQLMEEIDRMAMSTMFSGTNVIYAPSGIATTGTANPDVLIGSAGADTITGLEGNDLIYARSGDDIIRAGGDVVPGLLGKVYLSPGAVGNLAVAEAYIAANPPDATFTATSIDYPNGGGANSGGATVGAFLGVDAASLSNAGVAAAVADQMIYEFTGTLNVPANGTYTFNVGSDDGFDLQIDGVSVSQFPGLRGMGFTNANVALTQGPHSVRLVYFENLVGNGLIFNSNMFASGIVDSTATEYTPIADGDDTIYGGAGHDVIELRGTRPDYDIVTMDDGSVQVTDTRSNSPDGVDRIYNAETIRFGDGEELFIGKGGLPKDSEAYTTLRFNVADAAGRTFNYEIMNASTEGLFDNPSSISVHSLEASKNTIAAMEEAINRLTGMRAYVGSKQSQADALGNVLRDRTINADNARGVLEDANIAEVSTEYALQLARQQAGINVLAQSDLLRFDSISTIMDNLDIEA